MTRLLPPLLALAVLGALAAWHPGLRFVDFIGFAERAERLRVGPQAPDWLSPLYPIGYPAALAAVQALVGDVLVAGKALAVLAGAGAALAAARLLHPAAAAWLLAQWGLLEWGSTEGTDLPALALCLGALAAAEARRPGLAGALVGAACLCRYTALAALPVVLWRAGQPLRVLGAFVLATAPHWGVALALGRSPLPDQSLNVAIGAEGAPAGEPLWRRWPVGLGRALAVGLESWPARVGLVGLAWGLWRRQPAALALGAYALVHAAGLGLAFANPRLALPITAAAALGLGCVRPGPWLWVPALGLLLWNAPRAAQPSPQELQNAPLVELGQQVAPPVLSSSPWFYRREGGWLYGAASLRSLGLNPATITPAVLGQLAAERGFRTLVLEPGRVAQGFPALRPLLENRVQVPGLRRQAARRGWVVYAVEPAGDSRARSQAPAP